MLGSPWTPRGEYGQPDLLLKAKRAQNVVAGVEHDAAPTTMSLRGSIPVRYFWEFKREGQECPLQTAQGVIGDGQNGGISEPRNDRKCRSHLKAVE